MPDQLEAHVPIVRLISFGGGLPGIEMARERLRRQAEQFPLIDEVAVFGPDDLDEGYFKIFGSLIEDFPQGFGLWSWKPYLVSRELSKLKEGDILIYVDVGVELNNRGLDKFCRYLDHTSINGNLFFSVGRQHRFFTKPEPGLLTSEHFFRNQLVATIFMLRVCSSSKTLVTRWLDQCKIDGAKLLKDHDGNIKEVIPGFVAHRHDQAVLSMVAFELNVPTLDDSTYFQFWSEGRSEPFLALRNRQSKYSWVWAALWLSPSILRVWQSLSWVFTPGALKRKAVSVLRR